MTDKPGLSEAEYLDIVERIQQAMCIEPFRPEVTDVVMLIGEWRVQQREYADLLAQANRTAGIYEKEIDMLRAENERLRAAHDAHVEDSQCEICFPPPGAQG